MKASFQRADLFVFTDFIGVIFYIPMQKLLIGS